MRVRVRVKIGATGELNKNKNKNKNKYKNNCINSINATKLLLLSSGITFSSIVMLSPPVPDDLGCRLKRADMRTIDSFVLKVTFALECMPKASGRSVGGRFWNVFIAVGREHSGGEK